MSPYRRPPPPQPRRPPATSWWRLAWHWRTVLRLRDRAYRRSVGIVRDPERWACIREALQASGVAAVIAAGRLRELTGAPVVPLPGPPTQVHK